MKREPAPLLTSSGQPIYARTPRGLLRDPSISRDARLLWAILEDHSGKDDDVPWPAQEALAEYMGCSDRAIRNWLNELVKAGWLAVEHRPGTSNLHHLIWQVAEAPRNGRSTPSPRNGGSGGGRNGGSGESGTAVPTKKNHQEESFEEEPAEPGAPLSGTEQTLFDDGEKPQPKRKPRQPKSAKPVDAEFEKFWEIYPRAARGSSQVGNQGDKQDARESWDALISAGIPAATLQRRAANYADARRMAAAEWNGEAPLNAAYRWLNKKHPSWDSPADDIEDERIQYWRYACQQDAKRGGTKAGEIETAFAIACQTWDEAASALGRRGARWNELLAGHDPRIRDAIGICWSVFKDNKPEAERMEAFRAAWLSVVGKVESAA